MAEMNDKISDYEQTFLTSFDSFTDVSDKRLSYLSNSTQYNQVTFHNVNEKYPGDCDIKCTFSLADNVKLQAGDKIVIFKVGWVSFSDYITFVRPNINHISEDLLQTVIFKANTFPKNHNDLYQFCYVTSKNLIIGASTPFSFLKPQECEIIAIEDPNDPDLVVFHTRTTQLQHDLEKKTEEGEICITKYKLLEEKFDILNKEFNKCEQELALSKEEVLKLSKKQEELVNEKDALERYLGKANAELNDYEKIKQDFQNLTKEKQEITDRLQKEIDTLTNEATDHEFLMNTTLTTCTELETKNIKCEEELAKCRSEVISLMKRLSEESKDQVEKDDQMYEETKKELEMIKLKFSSLKEENERLENKCADLSKENEEKCKQLQDFESKLNETSIEIDELKQNVELNQAKFENLDIHHSRCELRAKQKIEELEQNFAEDKMKYLKEIEKLKINIETIKNSSNTRASNEEPMSPLLHAMNDAYSHVHSLFENNPFSKSKPHHSGDNRARKCDDTENLKSKLDKVITRKSELSEHLAQEKHRNNELEIVIKRGNEENAALKSRVKVLEYELATLKNNTNLNITHLANISPAQSFISEQLDSLNKSIPVIMKFNDALNDHNVLEQKIQEERSEKLLLQSKVNFLLEEDANMSNKLQEITEKCEHLEKEKQELNEKLKIKGDMKLLKGELAEKNVMIADLENKITNCLSENENLHKTVIDLKKDLVGKISIDHFSQYQIKIENLEKKLKKSVDERDSFARFILDRVEGSQKSYLCPLCHNLFPTTARDAFLEHFNTHLF